MSVWNQWTEEIAELISEASGIAVQPSDIVRPPDPSMGDFAYPCFALAKERKASPTVIAQAIVDAMTFKKGGLVESAEEIGPYVNVRLSSDLLVSGVVRAIENGDNSPSDLGEGSQLILEYAQPNTHKELHVGHLRNLLLGSALGRILQATKWNVVFVSYLGDVGAHVAKCLWRVAYHLAHDAKFLRDPAKLLDDALVKRILDGIKDEIGRRNIHASRYFGEKYADATSQLALENLPNDVTRWKNQIADVQRKLELHDLSWDRLWQETRTMCLAEMDLLFNTLGAKVDHSYYESGVVTRGQAIVDELLQTGVAKISQGAVVVDLEDVGLGVFLIRKTDGSSLYATKDLALAEQKKMDFPDAKRSLILVDSRQGFYFKQLFETLRRMGAEPVPEYVGYEFVTLKEGAMSSRKGNIISIADFFATVNKAAYDQIKGRRKPPENSEEVATQEIEANNLAPILALSSIKFGMLKQDGDKIFVFDQEQATSFHGATGPYCQYAGVRLSSILKKAGLLQQLQPSEESLLGFSDPSEKALAFVLADYPAKVDQASKELRPSVVAEWCLEAAQAVNDFYRDVPVLESEEPVRQARLRLVAAAYSVLSDGLELLGITIPEEM